MNAKDFFINTFETDFLLPEEKMTIIKAIDLLFFRQGQVYRS